MIIPAQNNKSVNFIYPIDPRQLENPIIGLVALQYILNTHSFKEIPPEYIPEFVTEIKRAEIMQSDFIKNAENIVARTR